MDNAVATFACPSCGKKVSAPARFAGRTAPCPGCGEPLVVPAAEPVAEKFVAPKGDPFANLIGFHCRLCGTRMYSPPDLVGSKAKCPDCYTFTVIPPPPEPPKSQRPKAMDEETYEVYEGEQPHGVDLARAAAPMVSFLCRLCQTHLTAEASQIGKPVKCPDCGAATPVPATAKPAPKFALATETYDVDAAAEVDTTVLRNRFEEYLERPPAGYRTLAAKESPKGRKGGIDAQSAPTFGWGLGLFDGLATAFMQSSMLLAWFGLSFGLLFVALLIVAMSLLAGSGGMFGWIGTILMLGTTVFTAALWVTIATNIYWAVMDSAATGARRVHSWPTFDVGEWMGPGTTVVFAAIISMIPGSIAASLIPDATSLSWPLDSRFGWSVVGAMLVFPVVLLSQLNETSMWAVLSPGVLRTMWHAPVTWLAFYASAFGLAIASMWIAEDLSDWLGAWSLLAITPVEVFIDLVYAWLLGRLAWIAGAATPREGTTDEHR
jgi:DNA-directed RNA polymerase subunit RPC12/RpoP